MKIASLAGTIGVWVIVTALATGDVSAQSKCSGTKVKAAGKKASSKLTCLSKGLSKGLTTDSTCVAKAEVKFSTAAAKADAKTYTDAGCPTIGDGPVMEAKVDSLVADVDAAVNDAPPASACDSAKVKAVGKKAASKLTCHSKALTKGLTVDSTCLAKADVKFSGAAAKAEAKSGASCTTLGDEAALEGLVDQAVTDLLCGDGAIEDPEQCDPPGSSCGGEGTCQSDCRCPCDFLDTALCLYPYPSDYLTVADSSTDTGRRVHYVTATMPKNNSNVPVNHTDYNWNDGFSPGTAMLTRVPNVDLAMTGAAPITDIAQSLNANAPVVLVNASTLAHHLMFVELDMRATTEANRSLIIRPSVNLEEGTRYIVALRNMKDSGGATLTPNATFLAYRDNIPTGDPVKEARRPHMESIFTTLADANVPRNDLYLAWDFTVASQRSLTERMLFVRDDGFTRLGANAPSFTVEGVFEHPCTAGTPVYGACATDADCVGGGVGSCNTAADGVNARTYRRVVGTYNVERYVNDINPPARFVLDADGLPTHLGTQPASFICNIPRSALPTAAGPADPARASIYGHGLLGSNTEVSGLNVETMANDHKFVFCATKWIGMASEDIAPAITILGEFSNFPILTDRLQQAMLNQLYLARLMIHPNGFVANAAFQDGSSAPVIDTSDVFFDGNSQGGIFGGTVMAIAQDITRGVLGVPGMNYSMLLTRSNQWSVYATVLNAAYANQMERPLLLSLVQMLWDRSDPNGYAHHITSDPLPNTPVHKVLLHEAFGDFQVTNVATEVQARTLGLSIHTPTLAAGRSYEVTPAYGIPAIASYPFDGSALIIWDSGAGTPPTTNTAPSVGFDPHSDPRNSPDGRLQKSEFLKTGGAVVDVCGGAECTAVH